MSVDPRRRFAEEGKKTLAPSARAAAFACSRALFNVPGNLQSVQDDRTSDMAPLQQRPFEPFAWQSRLTCERPSP